MSSRARTRSRSASSSQLGTLTAMQPVDHQQPHEPLGVPPVGLDPVLGRDARSSPAPRPRSRPRPRAAPAPTQTRSAPPRTPPASERAAGRRTPPPRSSSPAAAALSSRPTARPSRTRPPSRRARPDRPKCEPWSWSALPSIRMGCCGRRPRPSSSARLTHRAPHARRDAGRPSTPGWPVPPYGLTPRSGWQAERESQPDPPPVPRVAARRSARRRRGALRRSRTAPEGRSEQRARRGDA